MSESALRLRFRIGPVAWLWAAFFAVAITALVNARMATPFGFSDEYTYAVLSAHFGRESELVDNPLVVTLDAPNRVFLGLYSLLGSPPRPVFEMARILNSIWLSIGIGLLFLAAREGRALGPSLVVAIAYGLGAQSTYTAYFTPETMYAVLFFLQTILAALAVSRQDARLALLAGASAALLSLVKPHGLAVGAGTLAFMVICATLHRRTAAARPLWVACLAYVAALAALRIGLGRVLAPDIVVAHALTGSLYSKFLGDMVAMLGDPERYAAVGRLLGAHLAAVACLAGPALVAGLAQAPGGARAESGSGRFAGTLAGLTAWLLVALIVMTAVFTVAVEETTRLHVRYYGFCIPLLFVGLAGCEASGIWTRRQQLLGLVVWVAGIALYFFYVRDFLRSPFDAAEFLFRPWVMPGVPLAGVGIALLAYRRGSRPLLRTVLGVYLAMSLLAMVFDRQAQLRARDDPEYRAARVAVALADAANARMLIVAPKEDHFGLPYVYRIASLATQRANFLAIDGDAVEHTVGLERGTVLIGKGESLARIGVSPMMEIGEFGVAQIGAKSVEAERPPSAGSPPR